MAGRPGGRPDPARVVPDAGGAATGPGGRAGAAAVAIARSLCETAIWDEDGVECAWMGRADPEPPDPSGMSVSSVALGADLYSGTAGVGLFLAEMSRLEGDPVFAATAAGAVRRSCRHLALTPGQVSPLSFFSGHLGVVYAVHRLGDGGPGPDVRRETDELLDRVRESVDEPHHLDFLLGAAGAVPPLLWLAERGASADLADLAVKLGEELCRTATWSGEACCWDSRKASGEAFAFPPLTGLSHGASGFALALFELYRATGENSFLATARGALAYEDTLYSAGARNWVDTRMPHQRADGHVVGSFRVAWCHGGPGIALARARAAACDPDRREAHAATAKTALETTVTGTTPLLATHRYDASLCHGLAGLAETLAIGASMLDLPDYTSGAPTIADELMTRYAAGGNWPTGAPAGGPNPSLMIGNAGIGHHLLRLSAPDEVPPILLLTP
ncbi:MAG: hypothetical protein M3217_03435 [Actinomycetota bacterium]|nr:hypothetical protein [Actinomycetota bacterium]